MTQPYPPELVALVRTQVEELAGEQIRQATEDGMRLGLGHAAALAGRLADHPETGPEQAAALRALRAALQQSSAEVQIPKGKRMAVGALYGRVLDAIKTWPSDLELGVLVQGDLAEHIARTLAENRP